MKKILWFSIISSAFLLIMVVGTLPASSQVDTCVTGKCHLGMDKAQSVHPPVKEGMCSSCHQAASEPGKKTKHPGNLVITLIQQGADLCYMCHEPKNTKKTVHAPIMAGDCTSCHNPHQSENKGMLKKAIPALCFDCHQEGMMKQKVVHPPVAAGDCSGCHDNHQSDFPSRLVQAGNSLCFMCHPDKEEALKDKKKTVHYPVKDSCISCHSPHSTPNPAMLSAPVPDLCANCHPNEVAQGQKATARHSLATTGKACLNCHGPHVADNAKLLPKPQMELCLGCHDKELDTKTGKIQNMKSFMETNKSGHGPVRSGDCTACHNPHGTDYWRMLVKYYPSDFYTSYSDGKYALCFSCHSKAAFSDRRTRTATSFRNGDLNLHFVHVNKITKGRTCRACHEVHADTGLAHHVKDRVGFSYWQMPMNYRPGKNGGSCAPGCHGEKSYSR